MWQERERDRQTETEGKRERERALGSVLMKTLIISDQGSPFTVLFLPNYFLRSLISNTGTLGVRDSHMNWGQTFSS